MRTNYKNPIIMALLALAWIAIGTNCNTVRGVGRDVEKTGQHIEHSTR